MDLFECLGLELGLERCCPVNSGHTRLHQPRAGAWAVAAASRKQPAWGVKNQLWGATPSTVFDSVKFSGPGSTAVKSDRGKTRPTRGALGRHKRADKWVNELLENPAFPKGGQEQKTPDFQTPPQNVRIQTKPGGNWEDPAGQRAEHALEQLLDPLPRHIAGKNPPRATSRARAPQNLHIQTESGGYIEDGPGGAGEQAVKGLGSLVAGHKRRAAAAGEGQRPALPKKSRFSVTNGRIAGARGGCRGRDPSARDTK